MLLEGNTSTFPRHKSITKAVGEGIMNCLGTMRQSFTQAASTKNLEAAAQPQAFMPANFGLAPTLGKTDRSGIPEVHQGGNGEDELPPGITWRAADATEPGTARLSPRGRAANPPPRVSGPRGAPLLPGDGRSQSGVSVPTGFALSKTRHPPPYPPSRRKGRTPGHPLPRRDGATPPSAGQRRSGTAPPPRCPTHPPRCAPQPQQERSRQAGR